MKSSECTNNAGELADWLNANKNFERIIVTNINQLKAGDIMVYESPINYRTHTEIYAGNDTKYNAGHTGKGDGGVTGIRDNAPYAASMNYQIENNARVNAYRLKASSTSSNLEALLKKGGSSLQQLNGYGSSQLVVVNSSGSSATITFYEKSNNTWKEKSSLKCNGIVGANGVGQASEGSSTTPKGLHAIGEAFCRSNRPETGLSLFYTKDQYWVDEPSSKYYNQRLNKQGWTNAGKPHAEDMYSIAPQYNYGFVIKYNMPPTGDARGSAFFFHVKKPGTSSTAGCVAIDENNVLNYLKILSGAKKPYILII